MGKREHDESYYNKKIKKLKKKIRRLRDSSSENSDATPRRVQVSSPQDQVLSRSPDQADQAPNTAILDDQTPIDTAEEIPTEFIMALGDDGMEKEQVGAPISAQLALRWAKILEKGIEKDSRDTILKKYVIPENFPQAIAPKLNPEIKATMSDTSLKRDYRVSYRQNLLGKLLCCLGQSLTNILKGKINSKELIEEINDGAKIALEIHHQDSISRKFFALAGVDKNIKDSIKNLKTDEFLFGSNCAETIKSAQTLKRTGNLLKNSDTPKKPKPGPRQGNWKSPLPQQQPRTRSGPHTSHFKQPRQQPHSMKTQRKEKQTAKPRYRQHY